MNHDTLHTVHAEITKRRAKTLIFFSASLHFFFVAQHLRRHRHHLLEQNCVLCVFSKLNVYACAQSKYTTYNKYTQR